MAVPFLRSVAEQVHNRYKDKAEQLCIVLPSKRGALFLKHYLAEAYAATLWLPAIISTEELIAELSGLKVLEEIDLICHLYESYRHCYGGDAEPFDSFAKWGMLILQDFNEIDRYLADPEQLYENLKDIKEIENWSLGAEVLSDYQNNYLRFMGSLGAVYKHFSAFLLSQGWAYQGLAYREAARRVETSAYPQRFHRLLFCGFNALNAAELNIIGFLHRNGTAELLWNADRYYVNDERQEAGTFLRKNFSYFGENNPSFLEDNFSRPKDIRVVAVPRQLGQAQVIKQELQRLIDAEVPLDKVAVVLANEKLLWPVLQQLPAAVQHVNITMEYPLRYTSTYSLTESLIQLQIAFANQSKTQKTIYHKDLVALLRQPLFAAWFKASGGRSSLSKIGQQVTDRNMSFVSAAMLFELFGDDLPVVQPFLQPVPNVHELCNRLKTLLQTVIDLFAEKGNDNQSRLELEYLYITLRQFNRLSEILLRYPQFNDLQAFRQLFGQVVGGASAPFIGEPLRGLQIMGMLETRTLDFEHVILVNVNEGVLPSGRTINSFIPNDLKRAFGLPLYLEKDAIYAYHFYRLLQSATDVVITYDSETDTFGKGEKSRFVTQLELEMQQYNPAIRVTESVASYSSFPDTRHGAIAVEKTPLTLSPILLKAMDPGAYGGLSPSGINQYKECPLRFYFRYGAGLKETREVEESAEANTFGSILHLSLENLYKPFVGRDLAPADLSGLVNKANDEVHAAFLTIFRQSAPAGKALLQEEVIKVYVKKLLNSDLRFIHQLNARKQKLTLIALEHELAAPIGIVTNEGEKQMIIRGKVDRLDSYNGALRIIDYKSSVKDNDRFVFAGFGPLFSAAEYNKQLQLVIYSWLVYRNGLAQASALQPCIIPFKQFSDEPKYLMGEDKQRFVFSEHFFSEFESALCQFVSGIFDPATPFDQTADKDAHRFCPYNSICNFPD